MRELCWDLRLKRETRATVLSKQCADTCKDSHNARNEHWLARFCYLPALTLTTTTAEVKCGEYVARDHWKPKENTTTRMHEATSPRALATTHLLDPGIEEQVARNARGASNVLHVRGEDGSMYDTDCRRGGMTECRSGESLELWRCLRRALCRRISRLGMRERSLR